MNITEASNVSKHTKQEKAKEVINRPARFRICLNLLETPKASFLANYANILNIGQQTKKKRIASTANRHDLPALAYLLPTIRRPQSPPAIHACRIIFAQEIYFFRQKTVLFHPAESPFRPPLLHFFPSPHHPTPNAPQTYLLRIFFE